MHAVTDETPATPASAENDASIDPVTGVQGRPSGPGLYLHWEGRRSYRTRMPAPRVLEPVPELCVGDPHGNRVIEGDNLQVMTSLRSQYQGSVDVAYLDPPYNTGKRDFRYSDRRFLDPNADSEDAVYVNNEDGGRHTKWLNYMGPRLWLTWQLLAPAGVCFVSINDIELYRLGLLMDEIFDESNRLGVIVWRGGVDNNPPRIAAEHEYILCYAKQKDLIPPVWHGHSPAKEWLLATYEEQKTRLRDPAKIQRAYQAAIKRASQAYRAAADRGEDTTGLVELGSLDRYKFVDKRGPYAANRNTDNPGRPGYFYDVIHPNGKVVAKPGTGYRFSPEKMRQLEEENRLIFGKDETKLVELKKYLRDIKPPLRSVIDLPGRKGANRLKKLFPEGAKRFSNPKPVELMEMLIEFAGDIDAIVLDPFAGSGTTGHAVLSLNSRDGGARRFILVEEGTREDRFCRTLTAPRLQAAIEHEELDAGFAFEAMGRRLNRDAILELEREAIANLVVQTDTTGRGQGITKIAGRYVIGRNPRQEAICLCWNGRQDSTITRDVLVAMFEEASGLGLRRPLRVYGSTCDVGETESFRFCQIPDEILAALQLDDDEPTTPEDHLSEIESLETVLADGASR